ncbi:MAG: alanine--glyoxylate aminotransferase family protein [Negativicutes bacterium]|nr:alanine--glyoxylate aminotransferase family protein [Negativicutes bacterium]
MLKKPYLMLAGPTMVPERVNAAMNRQMINHRGAAFSEMLEDILANLRWLLATEQDVLIYPCSGSGAMEAAVANFAAPGDKVLSLSTGVFGDRWAVMAEKAQARVLKLDSRWGDGVDLAGLTAVLAGNRDIKMVLTTHNETSTAVFTPVDQVAKIVRAEVPDALVAVDAVSSLAALPVKMDEWQVDIIAAGSQKALMLPPGLGFLAVSGRAWQAYEHNPSPKWYWDAGQVKKSQAKGQTPYTPAVGLLFGLQESLRMIREEGLENRYCRHRLLGRMTRAACRELGLSLLAAAEYASDCVTAVVPPDGVSARQIQKLLREDYGITTAGGQKSLEGKIFRIGHLGNVAPTDILVTVSCLEMVLKRLGMEGVLGRGTAAGQKIMLEGFEQ